MTNPIPSGSGTYAPNSNVPANWNTQSLSNDPAGDKSKLDQEAFLKLLVAQLKYQDPMNPADGTQFLTQTAQFTQVEKLNELAKSQQAMVSAQQLLSASSLVGRSVTYTDPTGAATTGLVTSAMLGGDPTVKINGVNVPLASITEIRGATPDPT